MISYLSLSSVTYSNDFFLINLSSLKASGSDYLLALSLDELDYLMMLILEELLYLAEFLFEFLEEFYYDLYYKANS